MARKRSPDSTSDRQRIQFAYNADCEMPIGKVFQYLLKNDHMPSREGKHKGLDAMSAFWKPFAYQENGQVSEEERGAIARESIEALTRQIDLIRETFSVEKPESSSNTTDLKQEIQAVVTEVVQNLMANGAIPASMTGAVVTQSTQTALPPSGRSSINASSTHEGVDFDEDALLGGLFDNSEIAA